MGGSVIGSSLPKRRDFRKTYKALCPTPILSGEGLRRALALIHSPGQSPFIAALFPQPAPAAQLMTLILFLLALRNQQYVNVTLFTH